jgi:hypothetical protein
MKSKAKPAKGSARTKRFDIGGTVGALAGLGTLAYLMSRKKKGEDGKAELKPLGKFPNEASSGTSGSGDTTTTVDDAGRKRALDQSKDPRLNYMPDDSDRKELYSDINAKRTDGGKAAPAPVVKKKKNTANNANQTSTTTNTTTNITPRLTPKAQVDSSTSTSKSKTGVDAGIADAKRQAAAKDRAREAAKTLKPGETGTAGFGQSKPYPAANVKATAMRPTDKEISDIKEKQRRAIEVETRRRKGQGLTPYASSGADKVRESERFHAQAASGRGIKNGGAVKKYAAGGAIKASKMGSVKTAKPSMGSASKRADGIAQRGKTRGKVC